jgi:hypothetical protein
MIIIVRKHRQHSQERTIGTGQIENDRGKNIMKGQLEQDSEKKAAGTVPSEQDSKSMIDRKEQLEKDSHDQLTRNR